MRQLKIAKTPTPAQEAEAAAVGGVADISGALGRQFATSCIACVKNSIQHFHFKHMDILEIFKQRNDNLRSRFHAAMNEEHNDRYVIFDGPVNAERYLNSPIKVSWMLKEPYEEQDGTGGDWCFTDIFDKENLYDEEFKKPHKATWQPVIYCTYGILNGFQKWDDMPWIWNKPEMCDVVRDIAIINAQKLPSLGYSRTNFLHIEDSYRKHKGLLSEQIEFLNPDVLIFASTFELYRTDLGITEENSFRKTSAHSYIKDGKLYIDAYHPAQTQVTRQAYVDDIVSTVEEWMSNNQ